MAELGWLIERLESFGEAPALAWRDRSVSYRELSASITGWCARLRSMGIARGKSVAVRGDYSPTACALLFALALNGNVFVPLAPSVKNLQELLQTAEVDVLLDLDGEELAKVELFAPPTEHGLLERLRASEAPGLILFSSGTTGKSKASLIDFEKMLNKFKKPRAGMRTLTFLLLDHIGGINTLLHALTAGGTVVPVAERTPDAICEAIARHRIQLLPTTPTFLNILLMSDVYKSYDLSSLELITYGTEPMPNSTLRHLHQTFPHVRLKQTYGLSELGILQTKSREPDSLWVRVGGDGYETKIVDGVLWIRTPSAMLGYLNAPSPFDEDGWFNTNDAVEVDGEYLKILGRKSELINVGGEKVYPAEVEGVILQLSNVQDVLVAGRPSPITGQVVVARVSLRVPEEASSLGRRVRQFCRERLAAYKVPVAVELVDGQLHGDRFKKARSA
jgi:long-chain acyl-CoA synthetase